MGKQEREYAFNFFLDPPQKIKQGTQRMIRAMVDHMVDADYVEVGKMLQESKHMRYSIQGYEEATAISGETKAMLVNAGYASAVLDAMQLYAEKMEAQNEILKVNTKYRDTLLRILAKRGTLLHRDLASALGVSPSGLSAIITQMNATSVKLVNVEAISKYTLYSITPVAYKYITKQDQGHLPEKKRPAPGRGRKVFVRPKSKYGEQELRLEWNPALWERENQEAMAMFQVPCHTTAKYGRNALMAVRTQQYKEKKRA